MTEDGKDFATHHPWDRNFHLAFVAIAWIAVLMGFGQTVIDRFHGKADYPAPLVLHIHAALFIGWMVLLTIQVLLVRAGRYRLHKALGTSALALVPLMVVFSFLAERYSQHFYSPKYPANLNFFAIPVGYLVSFSLFAGLGLAQRAHPAWHKRLMLLANSVILGVPFARWWGGDLYKLTGDGFWGMIAHTYAGTELLLVLMMVYDLVTRRRIHPAYLFGVPLVLASQPTVSWVYHSAWWPPVAKVLVGLEN